MLRILLVLFAVLFGVSSGAEAHGIDADADTSAPTILPWLQAVCIVAAILAYARGVIRIRSEAGPDRVVSRSQTAAFGLAIGLFVLILSPEVDEVTDALFSAHMAQHLVLMLFIPPLLVWSRPVLVMIWGLPRMWRKGFARSPSMQRIRSAVALLMQPLIVATLFLGAFSFWHLPRPYAWSLSNEWIHAFEHLSFLVTAIMFWTLVIEPSGRRQMGYIPTMLYVAAIAVLSGLPGALMILSPVVLFKAHGNAASAWGLTLLADQQIAGLIMWVPAGVFFLVPIAWLFVKALQSTEHRRAVAQAALLAVIVLLPGCSNAQSRSDPDDKASVARGKVLVGLFGCGTCHTIPGIEDATGRVGPPLAGIADRIFIAGMLQNTPDNMTRWVKDPQSVAPGNAMPAVGMTSEDARVIATYLATLHVGY